MIRSTTITANAYTPGTDQLAYSEPQKMIHGTDGFYHTPDGKTWEPYELMYITEHLDDAETAIWDSLTPGGQYWIEGEIHNKQVQGIAFIAHQDKIYINGKSEWISRGYPGRHLHAATPLTLIPTSLWDELMRVDSLEEIKQLKVKTHLWVHDRSHTYTPTQPQSEETAE